MAKRTETQLVVTAKDLGSKTLKDLAAAFRQLRQEQRETAAVGDRTKVKQAELRATLVGLNKVLGELTGRQAKLDLFRRLGTDVAAAQTRLATATQKLKDFSTNNDAAAVKTAAFKAEQKALTREVTRSEVALAKLSGSYARVGAQVEALGLNSKRAEQELSRLVAVTSRSATETEGALAQLPRQQRLYREELEKSIAAEKEQLALLQKQKDARRLALEQARALRLAQEAGGNAGGFKGFSQNATALQRNIALGAQQTRQREADVAATKRLQEIERNYQSVLARRSGVLGQVTNAIRTNMAAQDRANKATRDGVSLQRTALSLNQRIRGQLLSLASAYIGVFGAISVGQRALDVTNKRFTLNARLLVANADDQKAAAADYEFLREEADRLGFSLTELGTNYSKLAIAGRSAGLSIKQVREIFSNFSEVSRVNGLGVEETERVFKALEQILSKGKVQAEELRGQLGDVLPGAYTAFARSIGKSGEQLDDLLKQGKISSSALLQFSREYAQSVKGQLDPATKTFRAEVGRLTTAFDDILQSVADDALAPAISDLSRELSIFLKSGEAKKFAAEIGEAISVLGRGLLVVIKNMDSVIALFKLWVASFAVGRIVALTKGIGGIAAGIARVGVVASSVIPWVVRLRSALLLLSALSGPLGIAVAAIGAAWLYFSNRADEAAQKQEELAKKFDGAKASVDGYAAAQAKLQQASDAVADAELGVKDAVTATEKAKAELAKTGTEAAKASVAQAKAAEDEKKKTLDLAKAKKRLAEQIAENAKLEADIAVTATANRLKEVRERLAVAQAALFEARAKAELLRAQTGPLGEAGERAARAGQGFAADSIVSQAEKRVSDLQAQAATLQKQLGELFAGAFIDPGKGAKAPEGEPNWLLGGDDKDGKAARDKSADEAKRLAEETADAIRDIYRSGLEQQTEDEATALAAKRQLIIDDYKARYADVQAIIDKNKAAGNTQAASDLSASLDALKAQEQVALKQLDTEYKRAALLKDIEAREAGINLLIAERDRKLEEIDRQRAVGQITELQARDQSFAIQLDYQDRVLTSVQALRDFIAAAQADGTLSLLDATKVQELLMSLDQIPAKVEAIDPAMTKLRESQESLAGGLTDSIASLGTGIAGWIRGVNSFGDALKGAWDTFRNFIADFLIGIAKAILQTQLLNAIQQSAGLTKFLGGITAGSAHVGGIIGTQAKNRTLNPAIFAAAQRYHTGGVVGLGPDEVPIVAKRGEEMLTENDPRHRANGGMGGAKINIINAIDSASVVEQGNSSPAGVRSILNVVRANKAAFKAALS